MAKNSEKPNQKVSINLIQKDTVITVSTFGDEISTLLNYIVSNLDQDGVESLSDWIGRRLLYRPMYKKIGDRIVINVIQTLIRDNKPEILEPLLSDLYGNEWPNDKISSENAAELAIVLLKYYKSLNGNKANNEVKNSICCILSEIDQSVIEQLLSDNPNLPFYKEILGRMFDAAKNT